MDISNQANQQEEPLPLEIRPDDNRWWHQSNQKINRLLTTGHPPEIIIEAEELDEGGIKRIAHHFWYQAYINDLDPATITLAADGKELCLVDAIKEHLQPTGGLTPETIAVFPMLALILDNGWPVTEAIRAIFNLSRVDGVNCTTVVCSFDPKQTPDFILVSLGKHLDIVTPYTRQNLGIAQYPKQLFPDGFHRLGRKLSVQAIQDYPYPLCREAPGPFLQDGCLYVPVNTPIGDNGVLLLCLDADTRFAVLPRLVYNGANVTGRLIGSDHYLPFRFIIELRHKGFDSICSFLSLLPFEPHIGICILLLCFCAFFDLCQANNIVVMRFLGEAIQFKTTIPFCIIRLLTGVQPASDVIITPRLAKEKLVAYVDERQGGGAGEDRAEKLLFNTGEALRLLMMSGRMTANDANMIGKSVDFDCTDAEKFHVPTYTDEGTRDQIDELRPGCLSFLMTQVPALLDFKRTFGIGKVVAFLRGEYDGFVKLRLAETLAPVFVLLREIEDLMIRRWGPDHDAESVFGAFMKYQERVGQLLEQAKNTLIENIVDLGRTMNATGVNAFPKGVKFHKSQCAIKGTFDMWFEELKTKYSPRDCPFKNKRDVETQLREAARHLEKTGWHFDWSYHPHNRPGVIVMLPPDFEKDDLPDDSEVNADATQ